MRLREQRQPAQRRNGPPLTAPFDIYSRHVLQNVLHCSASVSFEFLGRFSYGCWRCVGRRLGEWQNFDHQFNP